MMLVIAAWKGSEDIVKYLLSSMSDIIDVNIQDGEVSYRYLG